MAGSLSASESDRAAYVALALTPGIGSTRLATLLQAFTTAHGALAAPLAFLGAIPGVSKACATAIKSTSVRAGERALDEVGRLGGRCLHQPLQRLCVARAAVREEQHARERRPVDRHHASSEDVVAADRFRDRRRLRELGDTLEELLLRCGQRHLLRRHCRSHEA